MAVLRRYIDKRTLASINSDANINFAHGLPAIPDVVEVRYVAILASTTAWIGGVAAYVDATNVSLYNCGRAATGVIEVNTVSFHSLIQ